MQKKQEYQGFMSKSVRSHSSSKPLWQGVSAVAIAALASAAFAASGWAQQPAASPSGAQAGGTQSAAAPASQDPQLSQRPAGDSTPQTSNQDPMNRPLSDKERFKQQKDLKQELQGPYK